MGSTCPRWSAFGDAGKGHTDVHLYFSFLGFFGVCVCVFFYVKRWEEEGDREEKQ